MIEASAPAADVSIHKARLYSVTDASNVIIGTNEVSFSGGNRAVSRSFVYGLFTLSQSTNLVIQHRSSASIATNGMGVASSFSVVEVYTEVRIWKVA